MTPTTRKVKTVKSGREYRTTWRGRRLTFTLTQDGGRVMIHDSRHKFGLWNLERFGNRLTPAAIRQFLGA